VPPTAVLFGEVGLSGEVRAVGHAEARLKEAAKLGFEQIIMPVAGARGAHRPRPDLGLRIQEIRRLGELPALLGCADGARAPTRDAPSAAFRLS
jgi:DNA repair protein RadA/Sms